MSKMMKRALLVATLVLSGLVGNASAATPSNEHLSEIGEITDKLTNILLKDRDTVHNELIDATIASLKAQVHTMNTIERCYIVNGVPFINRDGKRYVYVDVLKSSRAISGLAVLIDNSRNIITLHISELADIKCADTK